MQRAEELRVFKGARVPFVWGRLTVSEREKYEPTEIPEEVGNNNYAVIRWLLHCAALRHDVNWR